MTIKTYRVYFSGKMSSRHSNHILHKMLPDLGFTDINEHTPTIRNMHRGNEEAYFDIDIPDNNNRDFDGIVETIKRYIVENTVQYDDITTEPPKHYKIDG
jgi:hypothetical protein